jgi:hypothetical protein
MRDFDMHGQHHHHRFGRHRMAKPLIIGVALIAILGLLVMSLWNALLPAILGVKSIGFWQALGDSGAVADPVRRPRFSPGHVRHGARPASDA